MSFSSRLQSDLGPNRLSLAVARARTDGRHLIDLTESNPTRAGFDYPGNLLAPLADPKGLGYAPDPSGLIDARVAVAGDYLRRGLAIDPERIVLTASTSEAYSLLFKVLCDPGADVLVPRPSYPLLDHLARLDAIHPRFYDLEYHDRWSIDLAAVERAFTPAVRAIVVVSPNNPTGSRIRRDELDWLDRFAFEHDAALIVDEVFADYDLTGASGLERGVPLRAESSSLVFSLGGLSKSIGLPQAKLAWIAAGGPSTIVDEALARLEFAADAYLSVSTPVQEAAADLLRTGGVIRAQIQERVASNYHHLVRSVPQESGCTTLHAEGGWYAVVRVPAIASEEDLVLSLLEGDGVLTHPGYFFDFQRGAHIVVSLLPAPEPFREGVARLIRHFACTPGGA